MKLSHDSLRRHHSRFNIVINRRDSDNPWSTLFVCLQCNSMQFSNILKFECLPKGGKIIHRRALAHVSQKPSMINRILANCLSTTQCFASMGEKMLKKWSINASGFIILKIYMKNHREWPDSRIFSVTSKAVTRKRFVQLIFQIIS